MEKIQYQSNKMYKIPLSPYAKIFYNEWKLDPDRSDYNIIIDQELSGKIDILKLNNALKRFIADYVLLNSHVKEEDERLYWVQNSEINGLELLIGATNEDILLYIQKPFNLENGPLLRFLLIEYNNDSYRLIVVLHHLLVDALSFDSFIDELSGYYNNEFYKNCISIEEQLLAILKLSNELTYQVELNKEKSQLFWKKILADIEPLDLSFLKSNPNSNNLLNNLQPELSIEKLSGIREINFSFGKEVWLKLNSLLMSPYLYGRSVFAILIHKYTKQEKICISYPTAIKEGRDLIYGAHINMNFIPYDFSKMNNVMDVIYEPGKFVKLARYDKVNYGYLPVYYIISESNKYLLNCSFEQVNLRHKLFEFKNIKAKANNTNIDLLNELSFEQEARNEKINYKIKYKPHQIDPMLLEEFVANYKRLFIKILDELVNLGKGALTSIRDYDLLSQKQYNKIAYTWNSTERVYTNDSTIHQLFEKQVKLTPDNVAVVCGNKKVSYKELNNQANNLAYYLRKLGVGPEILIGVLLERGIEFIVSVLAIFKAGGAYVPLDPAVVTDRISRIIEDAKPLIILTERELVKNIEQEVHAPTLFVKEYLEKNDKNNNIPNLPVLNTPDSLAYVIFTSGSTGNPKGVMIKQNGMINHLYCKIHDLSLDADDVIAQTATQIFDISVWQFLAGLILGGKICILKDDYVWDPKNLLTEVVKQGITILQIVPSHATAILNFLEINKDLYSLSLLRYLIVTGEALYSYVSSRWLEFFPKIPIINAYGPTECSDDVTHYKVVTKNQCKNDIVPIGKVLGNCKAYILSSDFILAPIGSIGEICIGGIGLARGYLNRPNITAEKFVPNPFARNREEGGSRLYRTGDLGRYLEDGNIEFLGRIDHQVKIRGFRIELGEIESVLQYVAGVKQCVVLAREDVKNQKRLVGYIVLEGEEGEREIVKRCREACKLKLPDYMQLSQIVVLDRLPLTPNGKIDRKALPAPDGREGISEYEEPEGLLEKQLANIWKEFLKIERIGRNDNFFSLGGDSIISIQMVSRARQQGIVFDVKQVFETPTIAGLVANAKKVDKIKKCEIDQSSVIGTAPLIPIQQRFFEEAKNIHYYNQAAWIMPKEADIGVNIDVNKLKTMLTKLYNHHDALRLKFRKTNEIWEQYYSKLEEIPFEVIDKDKWLENELEAVCTQIQSSLNIENGPLSRLVWFEGKGLFWVIHHLIVDGVSWRILLEDLNALYKNEPLPLKSHSYRAWGEFLKEYDKLDVANKYYKNIQEIILPLDWGSDLPNINNYVITFSKEKTRDFIQKAQKAYRTQANDLLLTALVQAIGEYTDYYLCIDLEGHGRETLDSNLDLTKTVGWFTSLYPVYLKLSDPANLDKSIKEVKEQLRQIPERGITYGIASCIKKQIPQIVSKILFNYLGQWDVTDVEGNFFKLGNNHVGQCFSKDNLLGLSYDIDINGQIEDGVLSFVWMSNCQESIIKKLANSFKEKLEILINHCTKEEVYGYTPSDFELVALPQEKLDTILHKPLETIYPLSPIQGGLLFQSLYQPESDAYFLQRIFELERLNAKYWHKTWHMVVNRYDSLRASFIWKGLDEPVQIIHKEVELPWIEEDWSNQTNQKERLHEVVQSERKEGFVLDKAPLMRWRLIKIKKDEYYFIWNIHHLLVDGWCVPIIIGEVLEVYHSLINNETAIFKARRPYRDYISWLLKQEQDRAKRYWEEFLLGAMPTRLSDKQLTENNEYGEQVLILNTQETNQLNIFAKSLGVTANTVLQGVWSILVSKYTRQEDIVFGVTVSGRNIDLLGVEDMVGIFINTLPMRVQYKPNETIEKVLKSLQMQMIEAQSYGYIQLATIQSLQKERDLFDSIYIFENYPSPKYVVSSKEDLDYRVSKSNNLLIKSMQVLEKAEYKLSLIVIPGEKFEIKLHYDERYFTKGYVNKISVHLRQLISNTIQSKYKYLGNISLPNEVELSRLNEWNSTQVKYPKDNCILELFEKTVENNKDRIAIVCEDKQLTYEVLNERANQLGHYLRRYQIGPEVLVGISVPKNIDLIPAILGILKSGGAYVPLDPEYPKDRLEYMLEDAGIHTLITTTKSKERFKGYKGKIIYLDKKEYLREPVTNLNTKILPDNLAYVIYTSGSTGRPKGAAVKHRGICNLIKYEAKRLDIQKEDRVIQFSSISFDASVMEWVVSLFNGASLHLFSSERVLVGNMLAESLRKNAITVFTMPPSVLETMPNDNRLNIKTMIMGGETPKESVINNWVNRTRLINTHGGTEISVCSAMYDYKCNMQKNIVGVPIQNVQIHILDDYLNLVPIGSIGEIYVGGVGLARGYLNRPSLTAERFIPNPFVEAKEGRPREDEGRLYKTGDLGRYLDDGCIEFLSRRDYQMKIRGFRIELGEIESTIQSIDGIKQCIVLAREDVEGQKRLVGYIVIEKNNKNEKEKEKEKEKLIEQCREVCKAKLPDYMQLSQIMILDILPLTPSGKIDRKALPIPEGREGISEYEAPVGLLEEQLVNIWKEILKIDTIGRNDNFFSLGGDSIISIQMVSHARQKGIVFDVRQVFETPTVAGLAVNVRKEDKHEIDQGVATGIAPLIPIQRWFFEKASDVNYFNQAVWIIPREGSVNIDKNKLKDALIKIYNHHDTLRLKFKKTNNGWEQCYDKIYSTTEELPFEIIYESNWSKSKLGSICSKIQSSLDIEKGPLSRAVWFENKGLFWVIHHLIVDGVSWRILLDDLNTLCKGQPLPLKSHTYKVWGEFLQRYDELESTKDYYKSIPKIMLSLEETPNVVDYVVTFTKEVTKDFIQKAQKAYKTQANDLLLTALVQAIGEYTDYQLTINLEGHGREVFDTNIDLTRTVGWFTSVYPVYLKLSEPTNLDKSVKEVKEQLRQVPMKGITYGIASYIKKQIPFTVTNVVFNYLGQWDTIDIEGNTFRLCDEEIGQCSSKTNVLSHNIDINGQIQEGVLSFIWTSNYRRSVIEKMANNFKARLEDLVAYCSKGGIYGSTPSDFVVTDTNQQELDDIFRLLDK